MTKSLISSNASVENPDVIFYNFVGNFVPPEWRTLPIILTIKYNLSSTPVVDSFLYKN
ncbi:MAG: hypothetical protein LN561_05650 [Rickettsia endosymbiont of Labidopullus appendiculatus]|nr:hypothetical protein [Rickettsia endosymbiont of Labidopullus appendiculatus]